MAKKYTVEKYSKIEPEQAEALFEELLPDIRAQDLEDLLASDDDILRVFTMSCCDSEELLVYRSEEGRLLAVAGAARPVECVGMSIWLIGCDTLYDGYVRPLLMCEFKAAIRCWVKQYGLLHNVVNECNKRSIRYMTYLGAVWLPEAFVTPTGARFLSFYIDQRSVG